MKAFLKSLDEKVQLSVETGWEKFATSLAQWIDAQKEATSYNSKAMNAIFNVVSLEEAWLSLLMTMKHLIMILIVIRKVSSWPSLMLLDT